MKDNTQEILETLTPLFERAEKDKLWFYTSYQMLWFSPKELRKQQAKGSFVWSVGNWQLRNPQERLNQLNNELELAKQRMRDFEIMHNDSLY